MWSSFGLMNLRFGVFLFGAMTMVAGAWLYFDSSRDRWRWWTTLRCLGLLILGVGFFGEAIRAEGGVLDSWRATSLLVEILEKLRLIGYLLIVVGIGGEPLSEKPSMSGFGWGWVVIGTPLAAALAGLAFLRRASVGLERHLYRPAIGLMVLAIAEAVGWFRFYNDTIVVDVWDLVKPFGWMWAIQIFLAAGGFIIFSSWVFSYLLKRFETQLILILSGFVISVCVVTTTIFSGLSLSRNIARVERSLLAEARGVLYTLNQRKELLKTEARWFADDKRVSTMIVDEKRTELKEMVKSYVENRRLSGVLVLDATGKVLVGVGETKQVGESLSDDEFVKTAQKGEMVSDLEVHNQGGIEKLVLITCVPVMEEMKVVGVFRMEESLDSTFLISIKKLLSGDFLALVGETVTASSLDYQTEGMNLQIVEEKGVEIDLGNRPYIATKLKIEDSHGRVLGGIVSLETNMMVLREVETVMTTIYFAAIGLMLLAQIPAILIAKFITKQIK